MNAKTKKLQKTKQTIVCNEITFISFRYIDIINLMSYSPYTIVKLF